MGKEIVTFFADIEVKGHLHFTTIKILFFKTI